VLHKNPHFIYLIYFSNAAKSIEWCSRYDLIIWPTLQCHHHPDLSFSCSAKEIGTVWIQWPACTFEFLYLFVCKCYNSVGPNEKFL
jgi:hypothetical protein